MENNPQTNVLVIEDDVVDRELICRLIGSTVSLSECEFGRIGLELATSERPDCVLLDYQLPDVDGLSLVPDFVALGVPVVMMTSSGSESIAVEAIKAGAQDYVTKDQITEQQLLKVVRHAIESAAMHRKIQEQQEEMASFVSVASHDLRAPLRHIVRFAELAREGCDGKVSPEVDQNLERVVASGVRMLNLLEALVSFARSGRSAVTLEPVCLASVVNDAITNLSIAIDQSNADINFASLPTVLGHEASLVELMQNLIGNAIKYAGGEDPRIDISSSFNAGIWTVVVRDNGIGISKEYHEQVFLPFRRLHSYKKIEGSGIGLASCQKILEHHGGRIWVESDTDQGATFSFTLQAVESIASDRCVEPPDGVSCSETNVGHACSK